MNGSGRKPDAVRAASSAEAPGTGMILTPMDSAARTRRKPGSEIRGVPESLTMATLPPASRTPSTSSVRAASLCLWNDRRAPGRTS